MNSTTNIAVVVILVLLVGFGVWYFTAGQDMGEENPGASLEVNLGGGEAEGGN